jgi:tetratricopeptide (TPR) repeat protein
MMALALDAARRRLAARGLGPHLVTGVVCAALAGYGVKTFVYCDVWQNSKTFWNTTLKGNPGCWAGWFNLGNQYKRESDRAEGAEADQLLDEAIKHYQGAIRAKRNLHNAYEIMDALLLKADRLAELERFCDQEIAINPRVANPYYYKGNIRQREDKYSEALEMYQKALNPRGLRLDADIATQAGVNASYCLMKLERWRDAIPLLELAVRKRPKDFNSQMNLGICYFREGELEKAEAQFTEAKRLRPNDTSADTYLTEIQRRRESGQ